MHTVKVGWLGQTFALAKCSDSGGKKSRIRRSKEERKALAESFIKKYQESNNGNFPSLNLAHKEVGGSFYTVREIVREIIQENRVLGPAKLTADEQESDQLLEQYPLGSVLTEPQSHASLQSNESHMVSNFHQTVCEEVVSTSNGQFTEQQQQRFDSSLYINGDVANEECKEADASSFSARMNDEMLLDTNGQVSQKTDSLENVLKESTSIATDDASESLAHVSEEMLYKNEQISTKLMENVVKESTTTVTPMATDNVSESSPPANDEILDINEQISQKTELVENVVKESTSKVTPMATDVTVETFPLPASTKLIQEKGGNCVEKGGFAEKMGELEIKEVEIPSESGKTGSTLNGMDFNEQHSFGPVDKTYDETHVDPSFENSSCSSTTESVAVGTLEAKDFQVDVSGKDDLTLETTEGNQGVDRIMPKLASNNVHPNNSAYDTNGSRGELLSREEDATEIRADKRNAFSTDEGRNSTLNRTKLESWEGASRKPAEANPVWGVFKAFISAFVKFWTE